MLLLLVSTLIILKGFERAYGTRRDICQEEYRYKLFALRDRLRGLAISGQVSSSNWLFSFLDSSIARTITILPKMSAVRLLGMYIAYKDDANLNSARQQLAISLKKAENELFAQVHSEYIGLVVSYVIRRNLGTILFVASITRAFAGLKTWLRNTAEVATESPEASTILDTCPEPA